MMAMSRTLNGILTLYIGDANSGPEILVPQVASFADIIRLDQRPALNEAAAP
jgi:hypothetical protein